MNYNTYVVLDFETGGVNPYTCEVTQLAAVAINPRSLKIDRANIFNSLIQPDDIDKVEAKALEITRIDVEDLKKAPSVDEVMHSFILWLQQYNRGNSVYGRPIPVGYNIRTFDMVILNRLCARQDKTNEYGVNTIFSDFFVYDLKDDIQRLTENTDILKQFSDKGKDDIQLTTIRKWLGLDTSQAHDAENDVLHTAQMVVRFLRWYREMMTRTKFQGAMSNV